MAKPTRVRGLGPDTPLAVAAPLLLAARLEDVRREEAKVADGLDPGAVHAMRVASRRLRATLRLVCARRLRPLEREVKALQDALGHVRDVQVQVKWLARERRRLGSESHATLRTWMERGLPAHAEDLAPRLGAWQRTTAVALERAIPDAGRRGALGGGRARRALAKRARRVARLARRVRDDPRPEAAHALRIAVKKLRYAAEIVEPAFPAAEALLEALEPLQEVLGELHDVDVRLERLRALAVRGDRAERKAARRLLGPLEAERKKRSRALAAALEELRGGPVRAAAEGLEAGA